MGVAVDFDVPTYLRVGHGMAVVSQRLDHLLPEAQAELPEQEKQSQSVAINWTFNPERLGKHNVKTQLEDQPSEAPMPKARVESEPEAKAVDEDPIQKEITPHQDATELSFVGKPGVPFKGVLLGSGKAPYRFSKTNSSSYFLRVDNHLIWGVDLKDALKKSGAKNGQTIEITFLGKAPIRVPRSVTNGSERETVWETRYRNQWDVTVLPE
ncbi:MAG: hypothetical protein KAI85_10090 [Halopseudomonas aestusnigri]|nr:hypothetical protein [Halopseudomonas aestusnigri]